MILIVGGPSGCGKSTVGSYIADKLSLPFVEADTLHPAANVAKMSAGIPLQDADRLPWLSTLHQVAVQHAETDGGCVMTCSALKRSYRTILQGDREDVYFVFLQVDEDALLKRMETRSGHFMKKDMLASQLHDLEIPSKEESNCVVLDASKSIADTQKQVLDHARSIQHASA
ncbi:P-loop containing nucleoside triphosphate hydrolase protein [Protomyces lactucae-debilis]|uniref:Gluconokinase n=1 Tax=Protomyces lactucae-debilis TaxID=2754530 RepID=A0A1Y2EU34_PROLT|nr:P-loop containing nucleoside triphosphate hydrolase protein [Protomyces lactucae-debilis]ORY74804.1 P-loop containing nucleoside triphosphate hydrolase protein [Protomyces lactucae-debilis]